MSSRHHKSPSLDIVCFHRFSPLSIGGVPQYSIIEAGSTSLTEPCLKFSLTRLFSNTSASRIKYRSNGIFLAVATDPIRR